MQPTVDQLLAVLTAQRGDQYVFGVEVAFSDPNPEAFDCSEFTEWGCHRVHVLPMMPDGAAAQLLHCKAHGTLLPIADAAATRGALLFRIGNAGNHVAVSLAGGRTIEARGHAYGVNEFPSTGRSWTHGALIPGLSYARPPAPTKGWFHRLLSLGSTGADVAIVQSRLHITVDGDYGPKTRAAVISWQRKHNLVPDGYVGPKTAEAMG